MSGNQQLEAEVASLRTTIEDVRVYVSLLNPNGRDAKELSAILASAGSDTPKENNHAAE